MTTKTQREIAAMAYTIADEIETRAQPLIDGGMNRDKAIMLTIAQMAGHLATTKG